MDAEQRREEILQYLKEQRAPASAASIARRMGVSRQVIVGDIALLRAQGSDIIATARGYTMAPAHGGGRYVGKVACQHAPADTEAELMTIVEHGGEVLDVVVDHSLYGEITGQLNIATPADVRQFAQKVRSNEVSLLSDLTGGIHLHTVACRDAAAFEAITRALAEGAFLYTPAG